MAHPDHATRVVLAIFRDAAAYERKRLELLRANSAPASTLTIAVERMRAADAVVDAVNTYAAFFGDYTIAPDGSAWAVMHDGKIVEQFDTRADAVQALQTFKGS